MEVQGAGASRPWLEAAGATFPTVVDAANVLGETFGYRAIPNGIFLDESGRVRFQKLGGFSVHQPADVAAIEALLGAETGSPAGNDHSVSGSAGAPTRPADPGGRMTALASGLDRLRRGDREGALAAWREALAGDPENFVIRKQIWAVEHPERFYPTIDWAWQREQLARERRAGG